VAGILGAPIGKMGVRSHNLKKQKAEFISKPVDIVKLLPDADWERLNAVLPGEKTHPLGGYAPIGNRKVLAAMIYLEHHNKPWAHVPPSMGVSQRTMSSRRQEWKRLDIWDTVWQLIQELASRPID
jgi:transposase